MEWNWDLCPLLFTYICLLSLTTFHPEQFAWHSHVCGLVHHLTLLIQVWLFLKFKLAQSTWERVDLWALLHRLTCVHWAGIDTNRQFNIPAASGRNSSFFSSLPPLSFLLPVLLVVIMEVPILKMSEGAGEAACCCCMSKNSQVPKFVFQQQNQTKKNKWAQVFSEPVMN